MEHKSNNITVFNKTEIYKTQVKPLIQKAMNICSANDMPMFFACCTENDEKKSEYVKECVSPQSHGVRLSQDYFSNLIAVTLGFITYPPVETPNISYDEE